MVSWAAAGWSAPEVIARAANTADPNRILLVRVIGLFLSAFVKQRGNPSERQLEIAHHSGRTEDHNQNKDDPENDLAGSVERGNRHGASQIVLGIILIL